MPISATGTSTSNRYSRAGVVLPMKTSARGFTLIEIMVVVVIIAIIISFATFSFGPRESRMLQEEAERIAALLQMAEEESILNAQELALSVTENGYQFEVYDGVEWQSLASDGVFRPRTLPENMRLAMTMDQKPVQLPKLKAPIPSETKEDADAKAEAATDKSPPSLNSDKNKTTKDTERDKRSTEKSSKPGDKKTKEEDAVRALILSSGEVTPFEVTLRFDERDEGYRIAVDAMGEIKLEKLKEKL